LQLAPGDFLFREGDKRDKMYVLLEGEMDIRLVIMWSRPQGQAR
jgi:Cyclic nucleotide-binding domain.